MQIITKTIDIKNQGILSTEYIENEISKLGITPVRWAIVKISKQVFTIDIAYDRINT